jgi:hypothetical protein
MSETNPITPEIRAALLKGARQLRDECDSRHDALAYVPELCMDVDSDLSLGWEGDDGLEIALRDAARAAIEEVYTR